jgi:hypothetical protein
VSADKKKACPETRQALLQTSCLGRDENYDRFRQAQPSSPANPSPNSAIVPGSGISAKPTIISWVKLPAPRGMAEKWPIPVTSPLRPKIAVTVLPAEPLQLKSMAKMDLGASAADRISLFARIRGLSELTLSKVLIVLAGCSRGQEEKCASGLKPGVHQARFVQCGQGDESVPHPELSGATGRVMR